MTERVDAKISRAAKELILYARATGKIGSPSDAEVQQVVEALLWFIWNHTYSAAEEES